MEKLIFTDSIKELKQILDSELPKVFNKDDSVAIKLHMGEPGNPYALKPAFVKIFVDALRMIGAKPFLFDSTVRYASPRNTSTSYMKAAARKGFSNGAMDCPVIVSEEHIKVKEKDMTIEICKPLVDADGVLVLTHVKGHGCTGFGGAIKNLGMGAVTKKTKGEIHDGGKPEYIGGCTMCLECSKNCSLDNIRYANNRPYFDKNWCLGCSNCVYACKYNALKPRLNFFDELLCQAANAALKNFKKVYFVNAIIDIAEQCDCTSDGGGRTVLDDVGFVLGKNIVAVEKATHDLIMKKAGKDLFKELFHKSPLLHIKVAEKLGMGSMEYDN